jgi:two-component system, sensor histidine kinase
MSRATTEERRVLLLPATRRDAAVMQALLAREQLAYVVCGDAAELAGYLREKAGVILLTDNVFLDPGIEQVMAALQEQPPWSDIPSILLCRTGHQSEIADKVTRSLRNVTILDRPTPTRTLISTLKVALRARERQYQMRTQFMSLQSSELALKRASDELQDASRRKDEFLAMLAHELRNPLAPLRNASEILQRQVLDSQSQKVLALMTRQVTQLTRLVDDLLDVSRITEGRIELRRAPVDISSILSQACESVEPLLRQKNHKLSIRESPGKLYVHGDHARLVQSVANVLINAAKYTDRNGVIDLSARRDGANVVIAVTDNGIGISPDLLPRLFDLFVQGERSLDRSEGGLGIGLSVVKRLVDMHGGRITASSAGSQRGSTFEIVLPLIDSAAPEVTPAVAPSRANKRILVVDDNQDAADTLAKVLDLDGHSIEVVYTAHDALARATATRPEVILLDVGLPDMSGYEVATRLRPILKTAQMIALTGYGQSEDVRKAGTAGFDAHVIKPVDFEHLARIISTFDASAVNTLCRPILGQRQN